MSLEDKELINPWNVIDTFFRDTNYYKSQHQIDSFDEFIFSDQNGLKNIIQRENPFILFKGETKGKGEFAYEIKIYYQYLLLYHHLHLIFHHNIFLFHMRNHLKKGSPLYII